MEHFLKQVAQHVYNTYKPDISGLAVIFPGKRSRLYFNKHLTEIAAKPLFAPKYYTITELMVSLSGLQPAENLTLIFQLYEIYAGISGNAVNIDEFYSYCEMLLSDFDEVDKYLVKPDDLFRNLTDLKELENYFDYLNAEQLQAIRKFWDSFIPGKLSDDQKSFVSIWDSILQIYNNFKTSLKKQEIAYEGLIYRDVAEKIIAGNEPYLIHAKYLFVGFNALNKAEDTLFNYLKKIGKAEFYWDYDEYYINNSIHEAGYFMRRNIKKYPSPNLGIKFQNLIDPGKRIDIVDLPSNSGQTDVITQYLEERGNNNPMAPEETAIVLADESLLLNTLAAIPQSIEDINVSMGYPLQHSTVYELVFCLGNLFNNTIIDKDNLPVFYYKDIMALLGNPLVFAISKQFAENLKREIINKNLIRLPSVDLSADPFLQLLTELPASPKEIPGFIINILNRLIEFVKNETISLSDYETEFLYHAVLCLRIFKRLISNTKTDLTNRIVFKLLIRALSGITVPFSGEPLKGMQVMGILETRTLDFKNIILLSANESVIPKPGNFPTFIPINLRYGFDLPVPDHRDAIYGYYFYRSIQRAKNIVLVYNSQSDGLSTGERSRFLHQLVYEKGFNVRLKSVVTDISFKAPKENIVTKTPEILENLNRYTSAGSSFLTPSAINTYLNCSLMFYFRYIAGLKEPEAVMEELDPSMFGSVLHKAVHIIYEPFRGKILSEKDLEGLSHNGPHIESATENAFRMEYFGNDKRSSIKGKNIIIKEIIVKYIRKILDYDMNYAPFRIIDLEKKYKIIYPVAGNLGIWLGGIIDRIDEKDGTVRIIDYKTGKQKNTFTGVDSLFDNKGSERNGAVFQTFIYALVFSQIEGKEDVLPGLYFIRDIFSKNFDYKIIHKDGKNNIPLERLSGYLDQFEVRLKETINGLFDSSQPFTQTTDMKVCENCYYNSICHRG